MNATINERRQNTNRMIKELLEERRQVWALYCAIAGMKPFTGEQPLRPKIQEFCQLLIDYISLGHFGIYQRIIDGAERRRKVLEVAESIYPRIAETTDAAVNFNDKYETLAEDELKTHLENDLSKLGEELATRIELEDRLISSMIT
ncbi:sigma D regulator [Methylocaldum szegediense]|uniref:Regulator of sigma D n=1 Tax=Methylocaldum szegediense TaxID=73780 RepID=A0ABM9I7N1_9GAMM|nr:sigma D regulator [Methylocaldum szegediense]CAI8945525.1 regulator of sigma D [Methylocaldum szegediense]